MTRFMRSVASVLKTHCPLHHTPEISVKNQAALRELALLLHRWSRRLLLDDPDIRAETSATERAGQAACTATDDLDPCRLSHDEKPRPLLIRGGQTGPLQQLHRQHIAADDGLR